MRNMRAGANNKMASLKEFFEIRDDGTVKGVPYKNDLTKRGIISRMAAAGESTLADLAAQLNISIPTATKLVAELVDEGLVSDLGKVETAGGRRPNIFGLASAAVYFAGIGIRRDRLDLVVTDLSNNIAARHTVGGFNLADNDACLETIVKETDKFLNSSGIPRDKILAAGVSLPGRVNPDAGRSYRYFNDPDTPLRNILEERLGIGILLENDTRAQCYAEYLARAEEGVRNMLYVNFGRGFAIGIVADGKLHYGKSGFAGEFGHAPMFDNNVICSCGKRGCLETEVSGIAIENRMRALIGEGVNTSLRERYEATGDVHIDDIIEAGRHDDTLSIELIEEASGKAGKSVAMLLNIFNPELVVIGGNLAQAGDYMMLPMQAAVNKHSLGLVYNDTRFGLAKTDNTACALGAAMMIRNKTTGLL